MANRRMFALTIIDSDAFLEMPSSTQVLYFHLSMRADDDGFVNNPKRIMRMIGSSDDDMKLLFAKRFLIGFESGVVVIKHWRIHNYIQGDRYTKTHYQEEMGKLDIKPNKSYTEKSETIAIPTIDDECIQDGYKMDTQVSIGKLSIGKDSINTSCPNSEESDQLSEELEIAEKLKDIILEYTPSAKVPTSFKKWAITIDRMIRLDHRTKDQIIWLFRWSQNDEFWSANVRSPDKLRKHWDKLVAKAKQSQKQKPKDNLSKAFDAIDRLGG